MSSSKQNGFPRHYSLAHLIHLASQHKDRLMEQHVAQYGVTAAQFKVLMIMTRDGLDTPAALCRPLSLDSGAMTRLLDRMASKGLLERVPSTTDRRQIRLRLTEQGRAFSTQTCQIAQQITTDLTAPLTPGEAEELQRLLLKLLGPHLPDLTGDTQA